MLSTHVLDMALGVPAIGLKVTLARLKGREWQFLAEKVTNGDGRIADFFDEPGQFGIGNYRLSFDVVPYFKASDRPCFYRRVQISFIVQRIEHFHVPLLLAPYGYSTYRGT